MAAEYDLFGTLTAISSKQRTVYSSASEDVQKQMQPLILIKWLTGTTSQQQIFVINEVVNPYVFSLYGHKPLVMNLLIAAVDGTPYRYSWKNKKKTHSKATSIGVVSSYYGYSRAHAKDVISLLTVEDILLMASDLGHQSDTLSVIEKEWKNKG